MTRSAVICAPLRTPIGRFGGALVDVDATALAAGLLERFVALGLPADAVDDVLLGQCYPSGEAPAVGRVAALRAGFPVEVPGAQLDRRCASSLQALCTAAMQVETGVSETVVAGGVESMSNVEFYATNRRWASDEPPELVDRLVRARETAGSDRYPVSGGMIGTAENLRRRFGITREEQDALALESHRRAVAAQVEGRFADELVPVRDLDTGQVVLDVDEHPRPTASLEGLSGLRPVMIEQDPDATVTAGNSSGQNDGAALCVLSTGDRIADTDLEPTGRIRAWSVAGVPPEVMGLGPVPAVQRLLARAGVRIDDVDLIELNEAFAAQVIAVIRELGWGDEVVSRVNVNGSGISLGHPVGATGCRLVVTLLHELRRRDLELGLVTLCAGGGQGMAALVERL